MVSRIGVAVRLGARGIAHADVAAGAALVLDEHRRAQHLLHLRRQDARDDVGRPARRVGDDDLDRAIRVGGKRRTDAEKRRRRQPGRNRRGPLDDLAPGWSRLAVV